MRAELARLVRAAAYFAFRPRELGRRLSGNRGPNMASEIRKILGADGSLVCLDIGGAADLQPHWHKLIGVARFVVYEPHDLSYRELIDRQSSSDRYRDFLYINEALSGSGGQRTLYKTNVPTGSSIIPIKAGGFSDFPESSYFFPVVSEQIGTTTLQDSLERHGVGRIDMIKLDTQGSEPEIMRGLDSKRLSQVLLVETELSVLDHYENGEKNLEEMLQWMRNAGFVLFDLRAHRFPGNAVRLKGEESIVALGPGRELPPNAFRLNEVDAIFVREPRLMIESGADCGTLRRLMSMLVTYNFFPEAMFVAFEATRKGLLSSPDSASVIDAIESVRTAAGTELDDIIGAICRQNRRNWGQYMWVPYPSS